MPTKTITQESIAVPGLRGIIRKRRTTKGRLAEADEAAILEGNAEEMVRELIRETITIYERYLDE
jgi:hypothetical protein